MGESRSPPLVDQKPRQQARLAGGSSTFTADIVSKDRLNPVPGIPLDDSVMFPRIGLVPVDDFTEVGAVPQEVIQGAAVDGPAAGDPAVAHDPPLAGDTFGFKPVAQLAYGLEPPVETEDVADGLGFGLVDHKPAVPDIVSERWIAPHPHAPSSWTRRSCRGSARR